MAGGNSGRRLSRVFWDVVGVLAAVFVVAVVLFLMAVFFPQLIDSADGRWFLVVTGAFLAIYPITYLAYNVSVYPQLKQRLEKDIRLLGLYDNKETPEVQAERLMEKTFSPRRYWLFIIPIIAVSLLIVLGYLMPERLPNKELTERPMQLVFFSLLGATVFSVQELVRRYQTSDLRPHVYATILVRILIAAMITFAAATVIDESGKAIAEATPTPTATATAEAVFTPAAPAVGVEMAEATQTAAAASAEIADAAATATLAAAEIAVMAAAAEGEIAATEAAATVVAAEGAARIAAAQATAVAESGASTDDGGESGKTGPTDPASGAAGWAIVVAFLIGMVPRRGTSWLSQRASVVLGEERSITPLEPLSNLAGISPWHESRLLEMGIDDVQNLATANILELLLTTRFSTEQVVNWIDQAILHTRVGAQKFITFRSQGITTYSDLLALLGQLPGADAETLRIQLGLSTADMLTTLGNPSPYVNYTSIQNYYHNRPRYTDNLADEALSELMGEDGPVPLSPADRRQRDLINLRFLEERLVARLRGLATGASAYERAETRAELAAVRLNVGQLSADAGKMEQARDDALAACDLAPTLIAARITLCQAYYLLNQQADTIAAANVAIGRDASRKEPYLLRGLARLDQAAALVSGEERNELLDQAAADFDFAVALDNRYADAYLGRARTRLEMGDYPAAIAALETYNLLGDQGDPNFWSAWGRALLATGRDAEARDKFDRAIESARGRADPQLCPLLIARALERAAGNQWPGALADIGEVQTRCPGTSGAEIEQIVGRAFVAAAGMTAGQPDAARAIYVAILNYAPAGSLFREPSRVAWEILAGTAWPGA